MTLYACAPTMIMKEGVVMSEEKKSRYTEAQARAARKYLSEVVENIQLRVPKGQKELIRAYAEAHGESMNQFIVRAINQAMQQDDL